MMGGCFAQDEKGQTVASYWPAHSVHVDHTTYIIKDYADDLLLPFWTDGVRAGGRLENVTWNADDRGGANILNWGRWDSLSDDFLVLGSTYNQYDAVYIGAVSYAVCLFNESRTVLGLECNENRVDYMEVSACDDSFFLASSLGSLNAVVKGYPSDDTSPWRIRVRSDYNACDVVSFWWINDEYHHKYFMVQPMRSAHEESAFYTHGYDILTEV